MTLLTSQRIKSIASRSVSSLRSRFQRASNLEYKASLSPRVLDSIAAMANTHGGVILIGVGETAGLPQPDPAGVELADLSVIVNRSGRLSTHRLRPRSFRPHQRNREALRPRYPCRSLARRPARPRRRTRKDRLHGRNATAGRRQRASLSLTALVRTRRTSQAAEARVAKWTPAPISGRRRSTTDYRRRRCSIPSSTIRATTNVADTVAARAARNASATKWKKYATTAKPRARAADASSSREYGRTSVAGPELGVPSVGGEDRTDSPSAEDSGGAIQLGGANLGLLARLLKRLRCHIESEFS